ncbi:proto-oncogene Mas-like [Discoglossus pictus]
MSINNTDGADPGTGYDEHAYLHFTITASIAIGFCIFGMVGNIIVFYYLCIRVQRTRFTVYIINLAIADFIFLIFTSLVMMIQINTLIGTHPYFTGKNSLYLFIEICYDSSFYCGMFFLTAISIERSLSIYFSTWYQCNRPKNLSVIVCISLWILGCSESLIENLVCTPEAFNAQTKECTGVELMTFIIGICICLPLMILSSVFLLFRIQRNSQQKISIEFYVFVIAAVTVFVVSVIPFNVIWFLIYFKILHFDLDYITLFYVSVFCTVLNSTLNPYIYFIAERLCKEKSRMPMPNLFHRTFSVQDNGKGSSLNNETSSTTCESDKN